LGSAAVCAASAALIAASAAVRVGDRLLGGVERACLVRGTAASRRASALLAPPAAVAAAGRPRRLRACARGEVGLELLERSSAAFLSASAVTDSSFFFASSTPSSRLGLDFASAALPRLGGPCAARRSAPAASAACRRVGEAGAAEREHPRGRLRPDPGVDDHLRILLRVLEVLDDGGVVRLGLLERRARGR
jgi:hypothetical protein